MKYLSLYDIYEIFMANYLEQNLRVALFPTYLYATGLPQRGQIK